MPPHPVIAPEIFTLRPDFTALSLAVTGGANRASASASRSALAEAVAGLDAAPWAEAHLDAWHDTYRGFGAKPKRTPCSVEALCKRALRDGGLRPANAIVDLYNAISLRYAIPVGGEDIAAYAGAPTLRRATGGEPFDTMAEGAPVTEHPEAGEGIWCDAAGVTCRRWNWRQGRRTQLTEASRAMWFVLERLDPMPIAALTEAGQALARGLLALAPGAGVTAMILDQARPEGRPPALES